MNTLALRELGELWEDYLGSVGEFFGEFPVVRETECGPTVEIVEGKKRYELRVSLPGLNESEFKVEHERGVLNISGKWPEITGEGLTILRRERPVGEFYRRFSIPDDVDAERIEAKFRNGILELTLPKKETEKAKTVKVEVH